jgi:protein gp37
VTSGTGCACDPVEETPFWGGCVRVRTFKENWRKPLNWNRKTKIAIDAWEKFKATHPGLTDEQLEAQGFVKPRRPRVFCGSLCDVFDNAAPDKWRFDLFSLIADTPYLQWIVLTKRIGNVRPYTQRDGLAFDLIGDGRVWLGITVCNQKEADRDIPTLLEIPVKRRFLSVEPMLGPTALNLEWRNDIWREDCKGNRLPPRRIDWVIVGGETGPHARPMHPDWVRSIRNQCKAARIPFFFKSWGEWKSAKGIPCGVPVKWEFEDGRPAELSHLRSHKKPLRGYVFSDLYQVIRVGKKRSGRLLDGVLHNQFPK